MPTTMQECENGNDVHARVWLATMCMFLKAWCKMHNQTNSDGEGTGKETLNTIRKGTSDNTTGKRSPPRDCGGRNSV